MKKIISFIISVLMAISLSYTCFASADNLLNTAYTLYVDSTKQGENVFSTIQEAKEYIRSLDKSRGDIVVVISDGFYEIDETVCFTAEDSGSDKCTIHYVAAKGALPIISGGKKVTGEWTDEGNGIYSINLNRDKKLRSLYVNGERRYMTADVSKAKGSVGSYEIKSNDSWAWIDGVRPDGVILNSKSIPLETRNPEDIELMTQTRWNTTIVCVDKLEKHGLDIVARLQMPYGAIAQTLGWGNEYQFKKNNMIYNVFENLNDPGEFYFDKSDHKLYYIPLEGEDLNTAEVVVPETETLVNIQGENLKSRVHDISFEGLTFAYTDWNLYDVEGSHGRATNQGAAALFAYAQEDWHQYIYRAYDVGPAAVMVSSAEEICFINNTISHTGNDGLSLINDCNDFDIKGNVIYDTAGATLLIGHPQHEYIGDKDGKNGIHTDKEKYDTKKEGVCKDILVSDNLFKDTSRLFWGVAGVMVYFVEEMEFVHNQVENTTYSGISLGWGWWNMNGDEESVVPGNPSTTMKNNTIKYNKFVNTITTLSDAGAIYTIGDMPGTIISENYIDSIGSPYSNNAYHIRGIHIDEGTKHVYGEKNVINIDPSCACIDCGWWGKKGDNKWDNNYSTSESYTTTDSFEPGTIISNEHYVPDGNWDKTAQDVVDNSGIREKYLKTMPENVINNSADVMKAIPEYKPDIVLIVCCAVVGIAVLFGAAVVVIKKLKKKKS